MAAHPDCRPRHRTDQARRGRDRLRRGVFGTGPSQPAFAADTFRNLDEETRARLRALPSNDQIFADAIKASRVVLGESGLPEEIAALDKTLPVTGLAMLGEEPQRFMFDFPGLLRNVPVLEHAAAGRGLFTIKPERDGIVRRVPMIMQAQGQTMPSLTFEMLRVATGSGTILIKAKRPASQASASRAFRTRPTITASSEFTTPATIPRSMFRRSTCWKRTSRPT